MTATTEDSVAREVAIRTAPAWRPEPGANITGYVARLSIRQTEYGTHLVMTLNTADGFVAVHCFHSVLKNAVYDLKPSVGDKVAVYYHGKIERGEDKPSYHSYTVVDPDAPTETEFSWDAVAGDTPGF